jgi:hypothetical protein
MVYTSFRQFTLDQLYAIMKLYNDVVRRGIVMQYTEDFKPDGSRIRKKVNKNQLIRDMDKIMEIRDNQIFLKPIKTTGQEQLKDIEKISEIPEEKQKRQQEQGKRLGELSKAKSIIIREIRDKQKAEKARLKKEKADIKKYKELAKDVGLDASQKAKNRIRTKKIIEDRKKREEEEKELKLKLEEINEQIKEELEKTKEEPIKVEPIKVEPIEEPKKKRGRPKKK